MAERRIDLASGTRRGWGRPGRDRCGAADLAQAEHAVLVAAEQVLPGAGGAGRSARAAGVGALGRVVDLADVVADRIRDDRLGAVEHRVDALVVLQLAAHLADAGTGDDGDGAAAPRV